MAKQKADKTKVDNTVRQLAKAQEGLTKLQEKLTNPDLTEEDRAELEQSIADFNARIERLTAKLPPAPTA
jgi:hypothetical protein